MKKALKITLIAIVVGLLAATGFQTYYHIGRESEASNKDDLINNETTSNDNEQVRIEKKEKDQNIINDVSSIVDNVMPSIVAINSTYQETIRDFFGRPYTNESAGNGSGFIIGQNDKELLIVTNNHVIEDASLIEVIFNDGEIAKAHLRGSNSVVDLAVLCIDIKDLPEDTRSNIRVATIGNSKDVRLGEFVIAIGNALGYGQSVTVGYVSAIDRIMDVEGKNMNYLQTDAAINPGNSGGTLLNSRGEVIGINTMKLVGREVEGIGYAIPITEVIQIINHLINRNIIDLGQEAYLGIIGQDVTETYSKGFAMPIGVFVSLVEKSSAADEAGILVGDIITGINGMPVKSKVDLKDVLNYTMAGSKGTISVSSLEEGEYVERTLDIVFGRRN